MDVDLFTVEEESPTLTPSLITSTHSSPLSVSSVGSKTKRKREADSEFYRSYMEVFHTDLTSHRQEIAKNLEATQASLEAILASFHNLMDAHTSTQQALSDERRASYQKLKLKARMWLRNLREMNDVDYQI